jgi:beta-lactam-binding protein with PASTA domain
VLTVAAPAEPAKGGGSAATAPVKVVLAAAKKKKPGLVLASAKPAAAVALKKVIATKPAAGHTRHKARKIKVSMKTLRKKINRAKTIRKSAEGASLEQIKKELQKAGILKADSKAPEGILRQMYADFMTLKSRAL